ncbi:uncharacterized protein F5147DRAFT_807520 [Suillus discolor]|uniref:Uncharacterized protein n=1 Tax=Suillus discolor TaxID=1912936 RepID=A0A9P7JSL9_9AGAM|nr:uncharacterized protein F5147DRAFT_807520 [Suillus discolor]KAG2104669.1 hypothetical protein F5147DRAFT_807520 [Suillus discolor]
MFFPDVVIIFLAVTITCGVIAGVALQHTAGEELILSGMYMCGYELEGNVKLLFLMVWMLNTVWEVLALSFGSTIGDCFRVLIQSHVLYFASSTHVSFAGVSCLQLANLSPGIWMFVLGPRLILSVREYHAKLVAYSDIEASMNSIVFQEHVDVSTSSTV